MHLAFVSNFAPDGRPPSQHGFHLVNGMRRARPDHALEVLSGRSPHADGDAIRHWDYGSPCIAQQMLAGLARLRPDAVFFNSLFTAWGGSAANFGALVAPLRAARRYARVATLLHHLPHTINARPLCGGSFR